LRAAAQGAPLHAASPVCILQHLPLQIAKQNWLIFMAHDAGKEK